MKHWLRKFIREERAQDLTEYSLLVALLALILIAGLYSVGASVNLIYSDASSKVAGPSQGGGRGTSPGSAGMPGSTGVGSGGGNGGGTGSSGGGGTGGSGDGGTGGGQGSDSGTGGGGQGGNDDRGGGSVGAPP